MFLCSSIAALMMHLRTSLAIVSNRIELLQLWDVSVDVEMRIVQVLQNVVDPLCFPNSLFTLIVRYAFQRIEHNFHRHICDVSALYREMVP